MYPYIYAWHAHCPRGAIMYGTAYVYIIYSECKMFVRIAQINIGTVCSSFYLILKPTSQLRLNLKYTKIKITEFRKLLKLEIKLTAKINGYIIVYRF